MRRLSNVTVASSGVGYRSGVYVDGFPVEGVVAVMYDLAESSDLSRVRIDLIGVSTVDYVEPVSLGTPIYDQLVDELEHLRTYNEYAGRAS